MPKSILKGKSPKGDSILDDSRRYDEQDIPRPSDIILTLESYSIPKNPLPQMH